MNDIDARTLLDRIWDDHIVAPETARAPAIIYVDLHLVHEVTSPQAFAELHDRGLQVRRPSMTIATMDHSTPTSGIRSVEELRRFDPQAADQLQQLAINCSDFGIPLLPLGHDGQGIVHVIGPELGLTQPGMTIVCGDSHTSTHGAFGALAFGIGTSEVAHVLATQSLLQRKPVAMEVSIEGALGEAVTSKDIILEVIRRIGIAGGTGHAIEYSGSAVRAMSMEARMTLCNMSIEAGARAGLVAPDDTTFQYIAGRPYAPREHEWDDALTRWKALRTHPEALFSRVVRLDAADVSPMVTFGTNPSMGIPVDGMIPDPSTVTDARERRTLAEALVYMDLTPGQPLLGHPIDVVFIGSCTNSRLSDLRAAARFIAGRRVATGVRMLVVPGSQEVKRRAEAEGLHTIFREAGAEWRESGCSMCIAMNGDMLAPGQYSISTSNRNFEGRQGRGGRTFLASPLTAAASAICGRVSDPRSLLNTQLAGAGS